MTGTPFTVCVYCGARDGARPEYASAATDTGRMLARRGWRLVYGAGDIGLMGRVGAAAAEADGAALGVIPIHLVDRERGGRAPAGAVVTETMHERKKVMAVNADAIVLLPGGAGSLDEFFEVLTWRQLGLHAKPILVLNVAGYWDPLLSLVERVIAEGFADPSLEGFVTVLSDVETLEAALAGAAAGT